VAESATGRAAVLHVWLEQLSQDRGVLLAELDLIGSAVESEGNGLVRFATVNVVYEANHDRLSHESDGNRVKPLAYKPGRERSAAIPAPKRTLLEPLRDRRERAQAFERDMKLAMTLPT
jgi:hypothetical protein